MTLAIAADRIRDLVILAFLDEPIRNGREYDQWRLALCTARLASLNNEANELEGVMPMIAALKKRRNRAVHQMAVEAARIQGRIITRDRAAAKKGRPLKRPTYAEIMKSIGETERVFRLTVDNQISSVCDSYRTLIRCGEIGFRLENRRRQLAKRANKM